MAAELKDINPKTLDWDQNSFEAWRGERASVLREMLPDGEQGLKALVLLALLDNEGTLCDYDQMVETINEHGVIEVNKPSIRTAVSNIKKSLPADSPYLLETTKVGLKSLLRLVKNNKAPTAETREASPPGVNQQQPAPDNVGERTGAQANARPTNEEAGATGASLVNVVLNIDPPIVRPEDIANAIIRKNLLPMYALYSLPRGASWWLHFSRRESEQRSIHEASAWSDLGIRDLLLRRNGRGATESVTGVISLAVGEGLGEIGMLRRIFDEIGRGGRIHYLAVDMSPLLLLAHFDTLRDVFEAELRSGQLVVSATLGNMDNLPEVLTSVRSEFNARGIDFLPESVPLLVTCLGNVLGNLNEPNEVVPFFTRLRERIPNRPLCILTGISEWGWKSDDTSDPNDYSEDAEKYDPDWYDFLSTTPRHLLINLKRLRGGGDEGKELFNPLHVSKDERHPNHFWYRFSRENYLNFDVQAEIHRFYYTVSGDLLLAQAGEQRESHDGVHAAAKRGTGGVERDILLCVITRFEPRSLLRALQNQGFEVRSSDTSAKEISLSDEESRKYILVLATIDETGDD